MAIALLVFTIDPQLEETMINAVHQSEYGAFLALDPHLGEKVIAQISDHVSILDEWTNQLADCVHHDFDHTLRNSPKKPPKA